jgi:hypothetical protein
MPVRLLPLRWVFLSISAASVFKALIWGAGPLTLTVFVLCGAFWFALSRWKVHSLDRREPLSRR